MTKPLHKYEPYHNNPGLPFDPLKYVKLLEAVGFTREQAEVQAETFLAIVQDHLATKYDLKELEANLKRDLKEIDGRTAIEFESVRRDIKELEVNLKRDLKEIEGRTAIEFESVRRDIKELEANLKRDLKEIEGRTAIEFESVRREIKELEVNLKRDNKELAINFEDRLELFSRGLKIWVGGVAVTMTTILSTIMALFAHIK